MLDPKESIRFDISDELWSVVVCHTRGIASLSINAGHEHTGFRLTLKAMRSMR